MLQIKKEKNLKLAQYMLTLLKIPSLQGVERDNNIDYDSRSATKGGATICMTIRQWAYKNAITFHVSTSKSSMKACTATGQPTELQPCICCKSFCCAEQR